MPDAHLSARIAHLAAALMLVLPAAGPARAEADEPAAETASSSGTSAPTSVETGLGRMAGQTAGSKPGVPSVDQAKAEDQPEIVRSSLYELEDHAASTLVFDVGLGRTTRIAIADDRIAAMVADKTAVSMKTDARTGEIYVIPLVEGDITAYVATAGGTTIPLVLRSASANAARNLVLKRRTPGRAANEGAKKDTRSAAALEPLPSPDIEAAAKQVLKSIAMNRPDGALMKRHACPSPTPSAAAALVKLAELAPAVESCWSTQTMRATVIRLRHHGAAPIALDPAALSGDTVVAVALERPDLRFGQTGRVILLEAETQP